MEGRNGSCFELHAIWDQQQWINKVLLCFRCLSMIDCLHSYLHVLTRLSGHKVFETEVMSFIDSARGQTTLESPNTLAAYFDH